MFDFLLRALRSPIDYSGVLRWHDVALLRSETHENGVMSFVFAKPAKLTWRSGQHGVWWFRGAPIAGGNWRAFSIASSPHEGDIHITTNVPPEPSAFKKKLLAMQPGETIRLQGPFGEFHAHHKTTLVGVAGGVGITPLRAIAYDIAQGHLPNVSLDLIYSAREKHTFQTELDEWAARSSALTISYVHTPEEVATALTERTTHYQNDAHYCLSGPPGMITALQRQCRTAGVSKIINDPFKGY